MYYHKKPNFNKSFSFYIIQTRAPVIQSHQKQNEINIALETLVITSKKYNIEKQRALNSEMFRHKVSREIRELIYTFSL